MQEKRLSRILGIYRSNPSGSVLKVWKSYPESFYKKLVNKRFFLKIRDNPTFGITKKVFYLLYPYFPLRRKSHFAELIQKKNVVILKRLQRFLKSIFNFNGRSHLSSFSTSLISFAVAVTIRIPLSLIVSSNVSSCRRCVFFVSGFSKRNWSTDIS